MARRRLGKKISYLSLFELGYLIDKHEQEVANLKEQIYHQERIKQQNDDELKNQENEL